jgi:integrase/recombinase XerD
MLGHASIESTQIYTQVSIRALQAVHASTHPAEQRESDNPENNSHNDNTNDTTQGASNEHNPLQNR